MPSKRDRGLERARVSLSYVLAIPALVGDAKFLVAYRPSERAFDAIMRHCPQERCNAPVITSGGNSIGDRALPALTHVLYIIASRLAGSVFGRSPAATGCRRSSAASGTPAGREP
jgi:hypothetical protein